MISIKHIGFIKPLLLLFSLLMTGCSNVASVLNLDSDLELNILARADINPDDREIASPLVIRLYELKDNNKFEKMSFYDIYQNDKELLGKNLVNKHVFDPLVPDSKLTKILVLDKKTKYIGIFAEFTQYKNSIYLSVVEIDQHFDKTVKIILTGNELRLENKLLRNIPSEESRATSNDMKEVNSTVEKIQG